MANGFQLAAHPFGGVAIAHTRYSLCVERRAACGVVSAYDRCGSAAFIWRVQVDAVDFVQRAQCPKASCGKVTCDAANAHAILTVGGDADINDGIVQTSPIGIDCPHRRVGREFDDAIMIVAQFQLRNRTHHAVGFDASDRRNLQHHAICGNDCAGWAEYAKHACARIGCAADHLKRVAACIDGQYL